MWEHGCEGWGQVAPSSKSPAPAAPRPGSKVIALSFCAICEFLRREPCCQFSGLCLFWGPAACETGAGKYCYFPSGCAPTADTYVRTWHLESQYTAARLLRRARNTSCLPRAPAICQTCERHRLHRSAAAGASRSSSGPRRAPRLALIEALPGWLPGRGRGEDRGKGVAWATRGYCPSAIAPKCLTSPDCPRSALL